MSSDKIWAGKIYLKAINRSHDNFSTKSRILIKKYEQDIQPNRKMNTTNWQFAKQYTNVC